MQHCIYIQKPMNYSKLDHIINEFLFHKLLNLAKLKLIMDWR